MEMLLTAVVLALLVLAVTDLTVGVGNDAVNFLSSAVGAKTAPYRTIIVIACVGMFIGAAMSNGMMDVARHGIFRPEQFSFYDITCICMAVMVTDIILLDVFNSLGLPTSTTVAMVFELLGASFTVAMLRMLDVSAGARLESAPTLSGMLNGDRALAVILGIFLSVAVAFVFGAVVQYLSRLVFSFSYEKGLRWKAGIFGGLATTAIVYFLIIKGANDLIFMTTTVRQWLSAEVGWVIGVCFVVSAIVMQVLHHIGVNVFKVIVLMGTFSLAMAFAGNDLVNFIGVPLTGLSAYGDFMQHGLGDMRLFMMSSLNEPAQTHPLFLLAAGGVMVLSLVMSRNMRKVVHTSVSLGRQEVGDEMFGSSRIARRLVRSFLLASSWTAANMPKGLRRYVSRRFDTSQAIMADGAAFDLVRASVNLVLAAALIALGTSLRIPLSTTYVTFMVAMGTSLADMAWGRQSAVFRITGVMSVIGGWFITAGAAFVAAAVIALLLHWLGLFFMLAAAVGALIVFFRRGMDDDGSTVDQQSDALFQTIMSGNQAQAWELLQIYMVTQQRRFIEYAAATYETITEGFINEDSRSLNRAEHSLIRQKTQLKNIRRKETLCLGRISRDTAIEKSAWFHLANNCLMAIAYNLRRMSEVCREHVDNNFPPLPARYETDYDSVRQEIAQIFALVPTIIEAASPDDTERLRRRCDIAKNVIAARCNRVYLCLRDGPQSEISVSYVYLNLLQESQEMLSSLRKLLRAAAKLSDVQ